jgi:dUTP pyrophosphatase
MFGIHKISPDVPTPRYATQRSACFDLPIFLGSDVVYIDTYNRLLLHSVKSISNLPERDGARGINLEPGECGVFPTGIIFDIPDGFEINIFPRSGNSGKKHLKLANCVAVIDEDYVQQTMLLIFNDSEMRQSICHGDRLAQAKIVPVWRASFAIVHSPPQQKTDRTGGFGHTGT